MEYWIVKNDTHAGPFNEDTLKEMGISPDTYVWRKGLTNWTKASDIPELAAQLWTPPAPDVTATPATTTVTGVAMKNGAEWNVCPPNYLAWAVVTTVLFCLPLGAVAIFYSTLVKKRWLEGNTKEAWRASERTAWFSNCAFVAGLIIFPFQILIAMI